MMNRLTIVLMALLVAVLAGCASTGSVSEGQVMDGNGQVFDTRDISDTYGYAPGSRPGEGGVVGMRPGDSTGPGGPGAAGDGRRVVYFDFDSSTVRPDSRPVVEEQARFLLNNANAAVVLEGHTDERGTREYNIGLGDRRANSVRQLLVAFGVSPRQIQTVSYGEERPVALGRDEASYARNRRVEFAY